MYIFFRGIGWTIGFLFLRVTFPPLRRTFVLFQVTLSSGGGTQFKGFLCQARTDAANADTKVGTLVPAGTVTMKQNCGAVSTKHLQCNTLRFWL